MKYSSLIDDNMQTFAEVYNSKNEKFYLACGKKFAIFDAKLDLDQIKAAEKNWKIHISVHPKDLESAWELIYPMLETGASYFKIVNTNTLSKTMIQQERDLQKLLENLKENSQELATLSADSSERNQEKKRIAEVMKCIEECKRFAEGMQITLYMIPGTENQCMTLLGDIEEVLMKNNIRPGSIYKTDRQIGIFSSIRHPGATGYVPAVEVQNYNPSNVPDKFEDLITKKIQSYLDKLRDNIQILISASVHDKMSYIEKQNIQIKNQLGIKLQQDLTPFEANSFSGKMKGFDAFKNNNLQAIGAADKLITNDKEWKPVMQHILLLLSGVGILIALISEVHRLVTGRFAVFDNKETLFETIDPSIETHGTRREADNGVNNTNSFKNTLNEVKHQEQEDPSEVTLQKTGMK